MHRIEQSTTYRVVFPMVDATDDETAETGLSPSVYISKNGGDFAAASGSVTEIVDTAVGEDVGMYYIDLSTTETNTVGPLVFVAFSGATTNRFRTIFDVQAFPEVTLTDAEHNVVADHLLKRSWTDADASSDGDGGASWKTTTGGLRSVLGLITRFMNATDLDSGTLTMTEDDDTTAVGTYTASQDGSGNVTGLTPDYS